MSSIPSVDVSQFVVAATGGDARAFARIIEAYDDDLVRVAYVVTRDVDLAHEAVQDAWAMAWRRLSSLREPGRLRPWLVAIAANEARQTLRRRRRRSVREIAIDDVVDAQASATADRSFSDVDLRSALADLSPDDRSLVAMRYALGMTSDEIGLAVGLSGAGVRSRLARILAQLREVLDDA